MIFLGFVSFCIAENLMLQGQAITVGEQWYAPSSALLGSGLPLLRHWGQSFKKVGNI